MTAREYLSQAHRLEQRINAKVDQIAALNDLATKCTAVMTGMPHSPNSSSSTMADAVSKIVDLQEEISRDVAQLVCLKREISAVIKGVENLEYQTLLERRYLCFHTWEQIALDMCYNIRHLYRIHEKALEEVRLPAECH